MSETNIFMERNTVNLFVVKKAKKSDSVSFDNWAYCQRQTRDVTT